MNLLQRLLPKPGDVIIGRYELREELGRGGFGIVFQATQLGLNQDVAIKVLLPHVLENEQIARRFEREVDIAKALRHPNTIRVLDCSTTEAGLPFYAMEFVRGVPLEKLIEQEGCLSAARTRRIMLQVLKSLGEAHNAGVVHRDLKPANLLMTEVYGEADFVKVLDFGIAKAIGPDSGATQTSTGLVMGTPAYMSPEQALGRKDLDHRTDLYAAGLILAECAMGRRVVVGDTPYLIVAQHASPSPLAFPEPLTRSPLWPVIQRATSKRPEQRYANAAAMREALEALGPLSEVPDPALLALAAEEQPAPSFPLVTPEGQRVAAWDPASETLHPPARTTAGTRHRAIAWVALALVLAALAAAAAFVIGKRDDDPLTTDEAPRAQVTELESRIPEVTPALPATPSDEPPAPSAADLQRLAALMSTVAIARERVAAAMPAVRPIRVTGEGVGVWFNSQNVGESPVDLLLPRVDANIELELRRDGFHTERRQISLLEDELTVSLRRREARARDETGDTHETPAATPVEEPASPFGQARIRTSAPESP